ncbi:MAG: DUF3572 domain-containing protein [Pseudomonadota bacterium]|uniref:DUF3572 domain-containing protein n=1 Tax=Roseovarius TaxID=74030 RepID=UPI0022A74302|nr:DUF3572 domain-containing protein [Roseovarius sp. EGI FJ00037]MCZ0811772.1 DUF3572 domain-containing protein [Roseovarius sp. EGI FJ00037]
MTLTQESAETIALKCLVWLMGNDELLGVFMGTTGASQEALRDAVHDPDFLGSVLDFILMDDAWVLACCEAQGLATDLPMRARAALPGGEQVNWT